MQEYCIWGSLSVKMGNLLKCQPVKNQVKLSKYLKFWQNPITFTPVLCTIYMSLEFIEISGCHKWLTSIDDLSRWKVSSIRMCIKWVEIDRDMCKEVNSTNIFLFNSRGLKPYPGIQYLWWFQVIETTQQNMSTHKL